MAQFSSGWENGGVDRGNPETDASPDDEQDRVSDDAVGVAGAADAADAAWPDAGAWSDTSRNDWRSDATGGAAGSANDGSQDVESGQRDPAEMGRAISEPPASALPQRQQSSQATADGGDSLAQPAASDTSPAPRQRQPVRQIGQIPILDDSWVFERPGGPGVATAAQFQAQHAAWMQKAQQSEDQRQQIAQINQSDPYISDEDGRWKKQTADPRTGAIHELDVLDTGTGKIDRGTGNIYVPTAQGPQVIGADPHQSQLAQIVAQKAQAQAQGSPFDASIAETQSALLDTQQQLQSFQGIPERLRAQIEKYSPISTDPNNSAAADQLPQAQAALSDWKQQNPRYSALTAQRDALANQLRNQVAAQAQNNLQVAQLLTTPQYVQWNGNIAPLAPPQPVSLQGGAAGNFVSPAPASPPTAGSPPASDISIHDLDTRAGVIAAQTGLPAGLAYASALGEAKQQGAQSVDGDSIDNAIKGLQPVAQDQLLKMTPPQLRQAFQSGLITRPQMQTTVVAQRAAQDQIQATADNGVSRPVDLAMRAFAENDRFLYRSGEYLSRLVSGDSGVTNWLKQSGDAAESLGKGEWGAVNPAFNKDRISQFASGLGDVVATAPAALATALALPEEGAAAGLMAAIRLGRVGMYGLRALPMALQFGAVGGAKAYDDTLASTGDRQKASDAATAGAWQAIKSAWPYLLVGGVAGLAEKAILPAVASPLLRGVTHAALSTVGNVVASGIGRAVEGGNPWDVGQSIGQDMAWSLTGAAQAAHEQAHTNAKASTAQDILAGTDPTHGNFVAASNDPNVDPAARQKAADVAAQMKAGAARFLQENQIPPPAPGQKPDPVAQSVVDLTARAAGLRDKIQSAFDAGGAEGAKDLATHREALADTESQLHAATQTLLNRVPAVMQARIAKAAAPDLDWNAARLRNAQDPMAHFATENLGSALRDQDIPADRQRTIRNFATAHSVNADLADHIANQAVGSNAMKHLTNVLRGEKIGEGRANTLTDMGLLRQSDPGNPTSPLHVTEDAQRLLPPGVQRFVQLKPELARYTASPDPAPGSALYQNAVAGMERFSKTAERMTPAPLPSSEAKAAPSDGETPGLLFAPPASALQPASESRAAIAAEAARLRDQYASAREADKPALQKQYQTLQARANIVDAVTEPNRDAKAQAFQRGAPDVIEAARQQVRAFAFRFKHVFAGVDAQTEANRTGGVAYDKAANRLQVSWNEIHNSAGNAYANALRDGATVEQARAGATRKIRSILDEELRHVADLRANGDAATKALWDALPPEIQDATRRVYSRDNPHAGTAWMSGTQLGYEYKRILSQNTQTGEVSELADVTKAAAERAARSGNGGWVHAVMGSLKRMADWLRGAGGAETARQLDALHAELAKIIAGEGLPAKNPPSREAPNSARTGTPRTDDRADPTVASSPSASDAHRNVQTSEWIEPAAKARGLEGDTRLADQDQTATKPTNPPEAQVTKNARQGKRFEQQTEKTLELTDQNVQRQVTIQTRTSTVRVDHISIDSVTGAIKLTESKSSAKARLTKQVTGN